jgi:hypothetical protein
MVQGGAALAQTGHQDTLCKAFRSAVKNWCADRGKGLKSRKGNFNDYFYRSLSQTQPGGRALAANLTREVGGLFVRTASGATRFAGLVTASGVLAGAGCLGGAARAAMAIFGQQAGGVLSGLARCGNALNRAQGLAARVIGGRFPNLTTRWADGIFRSTGRALEIKGPTDRLRPGQFEDLKKMGNGKDPAVVSCQTCKLNCSNSNPCPNPLLSTA